MLKQIDDRLWTATDWLRMGPGFYFPVRMMLAKLSDGTLWVHSPIACDDALVAKINALGTVAHIVAPNALHHLYLRDAQAHWPGAQVWHAPGVEAKRQDMTLEHPISSGLTWGDGEIQCLEIQGNDWMQEHVFLFQRTLILTDLVFHIQETRGWMTPWIFRMAGTYGKKVAQSRLVRSSTKDHKAASASCRKMLSWEFDRVTMAHGEIFEGPDAHARLERALAWMLSAA